MAERLLYEPGRFTHVCRHHIMSLEGIFTSIVLKDVFKVALSLHVPIVSPVALCAARVGPLRGRCTAMPKVEVPALQCL